MIGTVEFTGLEMTKTKAFGALAAMETAISLTIEALTCVDLKEREGRDFKVNKELGLGKDRSSSWTHVEEIITSHTRLWKLRER